MIKLVVNKKYDGKKLNKFLLDNIENLSSNLFYRTLRKKDIKINGKRIKEDILVHENDEILVYISDELLKPNISLDIVYEDNNILIINKNYSSSSHILAPTLVNFLIKSLYPRSKCLISVIVVSPSADKAAKTKAAPALKSLVLTNFPFKEVGPYTLIVSPKTSILAPISFKYLVF